MSLMDALDVIYSKCIINASRGIIFSILTVKTLKSNSVKIWKVKMNENIMPRLAD